MLIIIMELVNGGDLGHLVSERGALPELVGQSMASQMLSALGYLHKKNITHRDVKPDNILVSAMNPFTVKLTDFGLSKMVDTEQTFLRTFCGTLLYCAPEVYNEYLEYDDHGFRQPRKARRPPPGQRYDHAVDIWSLGGVIFYALTTKPPYPVKSGISYSELLHQIMTTDLNVRPLVERETSPAAIDFLQSMLNRRPENRARVEELAEHRWMRGASDEGDSVDEIIQGVSVSASQMSLKESESKSEPEPSQQVEPGMMDEMDSIVDDFVMEDSPEFDETFGKPGGGPPRLFGEVNVSAVGSSGVIPEDRLNISLPGDSRADSAETEIRNSIDNSERPSTDVSGGGVDIFASVVDAQSTDQLQSLVYNVQSQSLGGSVSAIHDSKPRALGVPSVDGSYFTTSKRKPVDTSDEYDSQERKLLPIVKRLRSEGNIEAMLTHAEEETALLASMQLIQRRPSGRQLDGPQDKRTFWETQDTGTWHLEYPEMTELQLHVFQATAKARGETFGPNKTPLWDLAMKYFPPTRDTPTPGLAETANNLGGTTRSVTMLDIPSTALQPPDEDADSLPDTLPPDTQNIVVPKSSGRAAYGVLVSTADSVLGGISLPVTEAMTSWGRHPNNTMVHPVKDDLKVPKFALRILQWREGAEPWVHHLSTQTKPWEHDGDADKYHFYLSTRATMGVHVNGLHVPLTKAGATPYWVRLQHGDEIMVWGAMATPDNQAKVAFHCFWGGSSSPRVGKPVLESRATALALEDANARTERRHKKQTERDARNAAAREDLAKRNTRFEAELARTDAFEQHILEAREVLKREASATPAASSRSS